MKLTHDNLTAANLRECETVGLGAAMTCVREYGHRWEDFAAKHPELVCYEIPAAPFREYLISGGLM